MLGVFVVCWLNMVIAPCATAFQLVEESSHHHAVVAEHDMAHSSHHANAGSEVGCCDALQSDCCELEHAIVEKRSDGVESHGELLAVADAPAWPALNTEATPQPELRPPDPGVHSPPLHKLYCVYLD